MRKNIFCLACCLSPACAPGVTAVFDWPSVQDAKSILVIAVPPGGNAVGEAAELDPSQPVEVQLGDGFEELEAVALIYKYPLRSLGLAPGRLEFGDGRALPNADGIFRASVTTIPGVTDWEMSAALPEVISRLELASTLEAACDRWLSFTQERLPIPGEDPEGAISIAVPLADGTAMLGTRSGRLFRASARSIVEIPETTTSTAPYFGAAIAPAGEISLIRGHEYLRGHPDRGFSVIAAFPGRATYYVWLADNVALTDSGEIFIFENNIWSQIGEYDVRGSPAEVSGTGAVARTGVDEVAIASPIWWHCRDLLSCPTASNSSKLEYLRNGMLTAAAGDDVRPSAIFSDAEHGTYAGTVRGELLVRRGDDFEEVGADPHSNIVWSISPANDGLFVAAGRGEMALYHPALGLCAPRSYANGPIRHVVPIDGGYIVIGEPDLVNINGGDHLTILD